jgi:Bifunctional DNA primase/polymerase, N-terminal/AAA domain
VTVTDNNPESTPPVGRSFISLFGLEPDQDVRRTAIAAVKAGYAVVPVQAGGKIPLCTLNTRELRAAGRDHPCGVLHAITDDKVADRVFSRLAKAGDRVNLGIVAGPSRLVTVDADNVEGVQAFQQLWASSEGNAGYLTYTPTVLTPGLIGKGGSWAHKGGGHWHFALPPGVALPWDVKGSLSRDGFDIKWGMSQALVPPSVRAEGPYIPTADILPAPAWLIALIEEYLAEVTERREARGGLFLVNDSVASWSVSTPWAELLSAHGWTDSGKLDKCGCEIWTKPGGGSTSYKSATAHESECDKYELAEGHGPLHLWTTEPPAELVGFIETGKHTITKLQYVAAMEHDGDEELAKRALGLAPDLAGWLQDESQPVSQTNPSPSGPSEAPRVPNPNPTTVGDPGSGSSDAGSDDSTNPEDESQPESRDPFWTDDDEGLRESIRTQAQKHYINERAAEYLAHRRGLNGPSMMVTSPSLIAEAVTIVPDVAERLDGVRLLYRGRVNTIFGPSEAGKSWFTMACLQSVIRAGGRVLVIDMEDDDGGFVSRLRLLGITDAQAARITYVRPWGMITASERATITLAAQGVDLIVVDSLDAYMALQGQDSNHAVSIRAAGAWLKSLAHESNAALLLVDHASEKGDGPAKMAMGSSAKKQFIDGATLRADRLTLWRPGAVCRTMVMAGKDRHGWAKAHAEFKSETADWGRLIELRMAPDVADDGAWVTNLELRVPPSWDEESGVAETDLLVVEDRIIDFLRSKAGEWQSKTAVLSAAGDKNGRGVEPEAVARLVDQGVIEHREVPTRGGRTANEYRFVLDESPNP